MTPRGGYGQRIRVDGLTNVKRSLASISPAMRHTISELIRDAGEEIEAGYKQRIPKDTGDTAATIGRNVRSDGLQVAIGSGSPVARWLELGTSKMQKRPSLYPAFRIGVRNMRRRIRADGWDKIRSRVRRYKPPKP